MSGRLEGKVCIVTGAGQGVGRGIALAFAREAASVAVVEWNEAGGNEVMAEIEALGGKSLFVHCDVSDRASVDAAVELVIATFGGIDVLVNNAQRAPAGPTPILEHTDETVELCFATGFRGTLYFMQACHPHLKASGGRIVNFASAAGLEGMAGMGAYGASKEAIRALSKTAAREWGPDGINVNIICPLAKSPGVVKLLEIAPEMEQRMTLGNPITRIGDCEQDIAPVAVFLASDDARYMTGQTLCADGGGTFIR